VEEALGLNHSQFGEDLTVKKPRITLAAIPTMIIRKNQRAYNGEHQQFLNLTKKLIGIVKNFFLQMHFQKLKRC